MLKGADISKWQGAVDFDAFKAAVSFVIVRSSYGTGYIDSQFNRNRSEARRVGLLLGYYHYAYPNQNTPEKEAEWFCKVLGGADKISKGEVLCLDFEESYPDPVGWSLKFLDHVSFILGGYKPLIYLNQSLIKNYNWKPVIDKNYGLWLAQYDYNWENPPVQTPWPVVAMRQYSNHDTFPGIARPVDGDTFYGDAETFKKYGYQGTATPPPVPTPAPIEQLPKDNVLKDMYTFLCGSFSQDEIDWRMKSGKNLVEIGEDICTGDERFYDKWIRPRLGTPASSVPGAPQPGSSELTACENTVDSIKSIVFGKGWPWVKVRKLKEMLLT